MNRPDPRRRSTLAGSSGITPTPAAPPAAPSVPAPEPQREPASAPAQPRSAAKNGSARMNYYTDTDAAGRIRSAYIAGRNKYGWRSLTEFQESTILERVQQLEAEFNNGEQFPPAAAGSVAPGRPIE